MRNFFNQIIVCDQTGHALVPSKFNYHPVILNQRGFALQNVSHPENLPFFQELRDILFVHGVFVFKVPDDRVSCNFWNWNILVFDRDRGFFLINVDFPNLTVETFPVGVILTFFKEASV